MAKEVCLKIIFAGTPEAAAQTLSSLISGGFDVAAVLTREDAHVGRKKVLTESPTASVAKENNIPIIKANLITDAIRNQIANFDAELGVVVAYGSIFSEQTLGLLPLGWVNLHYSLLPNWRGAAPVQAALLNGDTETGVSLFQLDKGMDTGPIIGTVRTEIQPNENCKELLNRLTLLGISLLLETIPKIFAGLIQLIAQTGEATYAPKISRESVRIDLNQDALRIERLIRAANPEPMAWAIWRDNPLQILEARATSEVQVGNPGQVFVKNQSVFVQAKAGTSLQLLKVKPAGKSEMNAEDWFRGIGSDSVLH